MLVPERAERAADGLKAGMLPVVELPVQGERSCRVSCVIRRPSPLVATLPTWSTLIACAIAFRTAGLAAGWPWFSFGKNSIGAATELTWKSLALFRRSRSGPERVTRLAPPVSIRFAAVVSLVTTFSVTLAGSPAVAVVAPPGPHV